LQTIKEQIQSKTRELAAHDLTKPVEVLKPVEDEAARAVTEAAEAQLKELSDQIDVLSKQIEGAKTSLALANRRIAAANRLSTRITSFEAEVKMLKDQSVKDCADLGLSIDDLVTVTIDTSKLQAARTSASQLAQAQGPFLDSENEAGPAKQIAVAEKSMLDIRNALAGPSQKFQQYLTDLKDWEVRRVAIEGNDDTEDTLKYFEKQLKNCVEAAKQIPVVLEEVIAKSLEVYQDIVALAGVFSELYAPVQKFIEKHPLAKTQFHMSFETKIVERQFAEVFLSKVAQNRRGSFNGNTVQLAINRDSC
jgi:hypothetical protein